MLFKKPAHRIFDYTPRYYDPNDDDDEKRKKRLRFRYHRKQKRKTRSPIFWLIMIVVITHL